MRKNKSSNVKYFRRRLFSLVFICIIVFFVVRGIRGKTYVTHKTVFPTYTLYKDQVEAKGYNILNEKVYKAQGDGIALYNASEGEKVPVGFEIVAINLMNDVSNLKDELIKVNSALNYKTKNNEELKLTEEEIESIKKIQEDLKKDDLSLAIEDINNLDLNTKQSISISELIELMKLSVDDLNAKKSLLLKQISRSNIYYNAEFSGIVSYKVDGLEDYYSNKNLDVFTNSYLKEHSKISENDPKTQVQSGDILFKLINNYDYKIALYVKDLNSLGDISVGKKLTIENKDIKRIKGTISKINKSRKNEGVVVISLDEMLDKLYSQRINNFTIIKERRRCFEIPKSSIIRRDNIFGVYVQEIHGLVRFIPIEVVEPEDDSSYISIGDKNGMISINDKLYKTITINDAIVINPKTVDESQILN